MRLQIFNIVKKQFINYFLIVFIFTINFSFAQNQTIDFEHLSIDQGLSQITVHSILQDSYGFLWFATEGGLNKYDGYNFTVYRYNRNSKNSLSDNFIWFITEDKQKNIWVGTNSGGLNKFDQTLGMFTEYKHNSSIPASISSNSVRTIFEDESGFLWIGTEGGGLNKFNKEQGVFQSFRFDPSNIYSIPSNVVLSICKLDKQNLLIGTDKGLCRFNIETNRFLIDSYSGYQISYLRNDIINTILLPASRKNKIYVGTSNGFVVLDGVKKNYKRYLQKKDDLESLSNNIVRTIVEDKSQNQWIGTEGGLTQFEPNSEKFIRYNYALNNPTSISNDFIRTVYEDRSGIIWIGTAGGGINKYNPLKKKFHHLYHDPASENSLSHNMVRSIYQDNFGIVWIGSLGGGLNAFDKKRGTISNLVFSSDDQTSMATSGITSILVDSYGSMWIGTWGGGLNEIKNYKTLINKLDRKKIYPKFDRYYYKPNNPDGLSSNIIQAIKLDSYGNLWIGTEAGLDLFNYSTKKFIHFRNNPELTNSLSDNRVQSNCIFEDSDGNLWIGTWNGLNKISNKNLKQKDYSSIEFEKFFNDLNNENSLSDNRIISIYETKDKVLWVGTHGGGLNKLEYKKGKNNGQPLLTNYTEKDGLSSDVIYGILDDSSGNLWMSSNNGLIQFKPNTLEIRNYSKLDGLQSNQFYWGSSYKSYTGELYFGGINGLNYFNPEELKDNPYAPPVYITEFKLFNNVISVNDSSGKLKSSITVTDQITLFYDENVISITYTALDYTIPEKNKYKYRLEGFDKNWVEAGYSRTATYTLTEPGEYNFTVIAANNDGVWNNEGASLKIIFLPPFWKTWWFSLLLIMVFGTPFVYFVIAYVKQLLAVERLRTKLAADLHDSIGSSLTEISILSEVISSRIPADLQDVLKNLHHISSKARSLVDEMSDIVWLVNPKRDSLYDLILRLEDTYSEILSYKGISFRSENLKTLEKISLSMEQRQNLFLIFKEGINNSITHSTCTELFLNAVISGRVLTMALRDNGPGFVIDDEKMKKRGNGLYNMKARAKNIGGNLKIESSVETGTNITFVGRLI